VFLRAVVAAVVGIGAGCGEPGLTAPVPTALDVPTRRLVLTAPGEPVALGVVPRSGSTALGPSAARYVVLDTAVVRVDADGVVRGVGTGRTAVVVSAGALHDTIVVETAFTKPVWRFSVAGAISSATLGGLRTDQLDREFQRHIDSVNARYGASARFTAPGGFTGHVVFVPTTVRVFTRTPREELTEAAPDADFKVVYHTDLSISYANYDAKSRVVQIGSLPGQVFTDALIGDLSRVTTLTHELAHARGAVDLLFFDVHDALSNPLDGKTFMFPPSIMHADETPVWDPLTVYIINASAGRRDATFLAGADTMVPAWRVTVADPRGTPVAGAVVTAYMFDPELRSREVTRFVPAPDMACITDVAGACTIPHKTRPAVVMSQLVYLVGATKGERLASVWAPLTDIAAFATAQPGLPYPVNVTLPN